MRNPSSLWTAAAAAAALGAIAALSFAPWHWLVLLAIGLSGLLWLVDGSTTWQRALLVGWLFGVGHFVVGLRWIAESFEVDAQRFGALSIPAVFGLSMYLACFPALACAATKVFGTRGPARLLVFAAAWSAAEWFRGVVLTGFPWNLVAYVWTPYIAPLQAASVLGAYGLGFVTIVLAGLPRLAFSPEQRVVVTMWPVVAFLSGLTVLWSLGELRLANAVEGDVSNVRLRLVQASIPQRDKWAPALRELITDRYRALSVLPAAIPPTHIVWPESALPFVLSDAPQQLRAVVNDVIPAGGALITGADRRVTRFDVRPLLYNSVVALDEKGSVVAAYDKVRLVPFGEYMPLRELLPLQKLTVGTVDFDAGPARTVLTIPGLPLVAPLICYEAIFPSGLRGIEGARWLLNVTNDAWFDTSAGPYQHFEIARMRAVEAGVPLVRAANSGISAVVDAYGRVRASLRVNQVGVLDTGLPLAIPGGTVYSRWGDMVFAAALVCVLIVAASHAQLRPTEPRVNDSQ